MFDIGVFVSVVGAVFSKSDLIPYISYSLYNI